MNMFYGFLGASLMAVSLLAAAPNMSNCSCEGCECTQKLHCGCFSESSCGCSSTSCECGVNCDCSEDSSCGTGCNCR